MIIVKKTLTHDIPLYTYPYLRSDHGIIFCFTTKNGGHSKSKFESLNVDYSVGDNRDSVRKNRETILNKIGLKRSGKIYSIKQVHGNRIINIDKNSNYDSDEIFEEADCIITDREDFPVMVMGADCNLILIADTGKRIIAAVHAGWKGTLNKLVSKVILFMKDRFKSSIDDLFVSFGPSIRSCCYRVTDSVLEKFIEGFGNKGFFLKKYNGSFLDLVGINYMQLQKLGVKKENISDCNVCTHCSPGFFSYRKSRVTGRQAGIAVIESR